MKLGYLFLAGGCNAVFGIHGVTERDGRTTEFFDAPIDAPFHCPPRIFDPSLSADGLRMVFVIELGQLMYTERPTLHDRFQPARLISGIPTNIDFPVMTADCGKLYFSGLQTTFYLEQ